MNGPDPPHWTLNSCLCASRSVWVYLAMFRYYTKLGAKRVELVQLMQKWCNSCLYASRSVWVYLAIFSYYTKLGSKRVELVQLMHKFVP